MNVLWHVSLCYLIIMVIKSTLVELREKYGVPKGGLTIKNIRTVFDEYGFDVSTFKSSFQII